MGDSTSIGDYPEAMDNYDLVPSGLVKLIKQGFNVGVDHSGTSIDQPTSFFVGAALNLCSSEPEKEIRNLHCKIQVGGDFLLTQPIYDPVRAKKFLRDYATVHSELGRSVLVRILPSVSAKYAYFLHNEVPGILLSEETLKGMETAGEEAVKEGIRVDIELIQQIKSGGREFASCRNSNAMIWRRK